jgi:hypothetical protein
MNCTRSEAARTVEQFKTGSRQSTRFRRMRRAGGSLRQRPLKPHDLLAAVLALAATV